MTGKHEAAEKREAAMRGERPELERRVAPPAPQRRENHREDEKTGPGIYSRGDQMRPRSLEHALDRLWPARDDK